MDQEGSSSFSPSRGLQIHAWHLTQPSIQFYRLLVRIRGRFWILPPSTVFRVAMAIILRHIDMPIPMVYGLALPCVRTIETQPVILSCVPAQPKRRAPRNSASVSVAADRQNFVLSHPAMQSFPLAIWLPTT